MIQALPQGFPKALPCYNKIAMKSIKERFIVDAKGRPQGIILDMKEYRRMLAELEQLECLRAYDRAKASRSKAVPFEKATARFEKKS